MYENSKNILLLKITTKALHSYSLQLPNPL